MVESKYSKAVIDKRKFGKRFVQTTISIKRKDGKPQIDVPELKALYEGLINEAKKKGDNIQVVVRAKNIEKMHTFKGWNDPNINIESFEDYLDGRVKETEKFEKFYEIQFTIKKKLF